MLRWLWDALFTRRVYEIVEKRDCNTRDGVTWGSIYILKDQRGNIKQKIVGLNPY